MWQPHALGDAGGDADRPVGSRGDEAVDLARACEPFQRRLVVDGDHRALVGVREPDRLRIAIGGDDVEPAPAGGFEQPELRRPGA